MGLFGKPNRHTVLRQWRQRHGRSEPGPFRHDPFGVDPFGVDANAPAAPTVRARRRAPTPKLVPTPAELIALGRTRPRTLVAAAAGVGLAAAFAGILLAPRFRVSGAMVTGNRRVPAEAIFAASGIQGRHLLLIDRAEAARRIRQLDEIRSAEVGIAWPARAWIKVEETRPVLLWQGPAGALAVDENGRAIGAPVAPGAPASAGQDLIRVRDVSNDGLLRHRGDHLPPGAVAAAVGLAPYFPNLAYRPDVGHLTTTDQGWEVRHGLQTKSSLVARQQATLKALVARLAERHANVAFIDLRPVERPFYRLRGESGS
jgi:cell division septal protein FtsQ